MNMKYVGEDNKRRIVVNIVQDRNTSQDILYTFSYPETKIDFRIAKRKGEEPANCFVKIYGLNRRTNPVFKKKKGLQQRIEVFYGRGEELSIVYKGVIERAVYEYDKGSQTMSFVCTKSMDKYSREVKSIGVKGKESLRNAITSVAAVYGYKVKFGKGDFSSLTAGRIGLTGTFMDAMSTIIPKGYTYYLDEDFFYVCETTSHYPKECKLTMESGLLNYPSEDSEGKNTRIKSVLLPYAEAGMKIKIPVDKYWYSDKDTGTYKDFIVSGFISEFNNGIGTTDFECEGGGVK